MVTLDNVLSLLLCAFEHIVWKMRFTNKLLLLLLLFHVFEIPEVKHGQIQHKMNNAI